MLALIGAAAAVSPPPPRPPPPPSPPPPPPLLPLGLGETACQDLSLPEGHRAVYSVFGGSNTQGANAIALNFKGATVYGRGGNPSFAMLLAKRLKDTHVAKWNADGGAGPILAGTCASMFVPPDTRLGTIEYLPNLGYIHEDKAEVGAIKAMLHMMRARGAAAFLVNIVSGTKRYENDARGGGQGLECRKQNYRENVIGCMGRVRLLAFRDKLVRAANETGAQVITIDADEVPHLFGADSFHLNANGHRTVFNEIWRLYSALPCAEHRENARTEVDEDIGVACALGDELEPLVGLADGFERTDLASGLGKAPKIGWATKRTAAALALCTKLPRAQKEAHERAAPGLITLNERDARKLPLRPGFPYRISVGLQASHPRNLPRFGVARVDCVGACNCTCDGAGETVTDPSGCKLDTLSNTSAVTVTTYLNLKVTEVDPASTNTPGTEWGCPADACVVRVTNTAYEERAAHDEWGERSRVIVRALIVGLNDWRTDAFSSPKKLHKGGMANVRMR